MKSMHALMKTRGSGTLLLPRIYVAAACLLDGLRATELKPPLGESVLTGDPFGLSGLSLHAVGYVIIVAGAMLLVGLMTRAAACVPIIVGLMIVWHTADRVQAMETAAALNQIVRAMGVTTVGILLLVHGAGVWSLDGSLTSASH